MAQQSLLWKEKNKCWLIFRSIDNSLPDKAYGGKKTLYFGYNQKHYNISWPNKVYFGKKKINVG